ncbi:MAG: dipicolinate synthase subunit B [Oscillospiraceae bacterium]|jgi:dipicolinate synthase subunit B|nr:dipicolinate synthase subunit B [Oscillospiraceae bacterium]
MDADVKELKGKRIGLAMTGSFCTFARVLKVVKTLVEAGAIVQPILSYASAQSDTRFMKASELSEQLERITSSAPWTTLQQVEPIGPQRKVDMVIMAPATGNSMAKLAHGVADTPALLAVKSALRNGSPVVIAVSTNDGLAAAAQNIGILLSRKHIFLTPFGQDDPSAKPTSLVARMESIPQTAAMAFRGEQIQPILV